VHNVPCRSRALVFTHRLFQADTAANLDVEIRLDDTHLFEELSWWANAMTMQVFISSEGAGVDSPFCKGPVKVGDARNGVEARGDCRGGYSSDAFSISSVRIGIDSPFCPRRGRGPRVWPR
jgi:hypothetical protein